MGGQSVAESQKDRFLAISLSLTEAGEMDEMRWRTEATMDDFISCGRRVPIRLRYCVSAPQMMITISRCAITNIYRFVSHNLRKAVIEFIAVNNFGCDELMGIRVFRRGRPLTWGESCEVIAIK